MRREELEKGEIAVALFRISGFDKKYRMHPHFGERKLINLCFHVQNVCGISLIFRLPSELPQRQDLYVNFLPLEKFGE